MSTTTTTCPSCGYNLPHHGPGCPEAPAPVFYCRDHAPAEAQGYDDARITCSVCSVVTYGGRVVR